MQAVRHRRAELQSKLTTAEERLRTAIADPKEGAFLLAAAIGELIGIAPTYGMEAPTTIESRACATLGLESLGVSAHVSFLATKPEARAKQVDLIIEVVGQQPQRHHFRYLPDIIGLIVRLFPAGDEPKETKERGDAHAG